MLKNQFASNKQQLADTQRKLQEADELILEIKERVSVFFYYFLGCIKSLVRLTWIVFKMGG